jgi:transcriptional regulator with XRE-family HTH domain
MPKAQSTPPLRNPKALAVGRRIAEKREQKGYTQAQLAARIDVTDGAVTQYETGRSIPRNTRLERIALELNTSVGYLLAGDDPEEQSKAQTKEELEALVILRSLSVPEQQAAMAMLVGLANRKRK